MGRHILEACKSFLPPPPARILDPFAGIGTTAEMLPDYDVVGVEIEAEWAEQNTSTICGDALTVVPTLKEFDAVLTSPTYGNRMADDFNSKDSSKRITYRHYLDRPLTKGTTSNLHFGRKAGKYEDLHKKIWKVSIDVLKPQGLFILNIKDFIAKGKVMPVSDWHIETLKGLGMCLLSHKKVNSPGMRFGSNNTLRVEHENVLVFKKL